MRIRVVTINSGQKICIKNYCCRWTLAEQHSYKLNKEKTNFGVIKYVIVPFKYKKKTGKQLPKGLFLFFSFLFVGGKRSTILSILFISNQK